ncbi:DDB1- and CUL4-associated factor 6-like isoform X2 [Tachypleus tridentatus]
MMKKSIQQRILNQDIAYGLVNQKALYDIAKGSKNLIQRLGLKADLPIHRGCVNTLSWNSSGQYLLSGSDDCCLCITDIYREKLVVSTKTNHAANIFNAKFLPQTENRHVVSCAGDGMIIFSDVENPDTSLKNCFTCHFGSAYKLETVPNDPHTFLSCGEDGTVRWFDLRTKTRCFKKECTEDILINCRCSVTSLAVSPFTPYYICVGCSDSSVRIYDRRMLATGFPKSWPRSALYSFTVPEVSARNCRITSVEYSPDGQELLVSYSSDQIYLFNIQAGRKEEPKVLTNPSKILEREILCPVHTDGFAMENILDEKEDQGVNSEGNSFCYTEEKEEMKLGKVVLNKNIENLEKELSLYRKHFFEMHQLEPVINLVYSNLGLNSGVITFSEATRDGQEHLNLPTPVWNGRYCRNPHGIISHCQNLPRSYGLHPSVRSSFTGHRNIQSMINDATFWGKDFILSGSDCGHIFIWDRWTSDIVLVLKADDCVVNCIRPHPYDPILASSGMGHSIKVWAPMFDEPFFDWMKTTELIQHNARLLCESKEVLRVPAHLMVHILSSLSRVRAGGTELN